MAIPDNYEKLSNHVSMFNSQRIIMRYNEIDMICINASNSLKYATILQFYNHVESLYSTLYRIIPENVRKNVATVRSRFNELTNLVDSNKSVRGKKAVVELLNLCKQFKFYVENGPQQDHEFFFRFEHQDQRGIEENLFFDSKKVEKIGKVENDTKGSTKK